MLKDSRPKVNATSGTLQIRCNRWVNLFTSTEWSRIEDETTHWSLRVPWRRKERILANKRSRAKEQQFSDSDLQSLQSITSKQLRVANLGLQWTPKIRTCGKIGQVKRMFCNKGRFSLQIQPPVSLHCVVWGRWEVFNLNTDWENCIQ